MSDTSSEVYVYVIELYEVKFAVYDTPGINLGCEISIRYKNLLSIRLILRECADKRLVVLSLSLD